MDHPACVSSFIVNMQAAIRYALKQNINSVEVICLCAREHIFPDACLPISALIQEFKIIYNIEINVSIKNNHYLETCNFINPLNLPVEKINKFRNPLNKIFVYEADNSDSPQAVALNQAFGDCISRTVECKKGVLGGLTWCVYEVMDNVLLHSKSKRGYVMAQYHMYIPSLLKSAGISPLIIVAPRFFNKTTTKFNVCVLPLEPLPQRPIIFGFVVFILNLLNLFF